jgi:hypothetical protein
MRRLLLVLVLLLSACGDDGSTADPPPTTVEADDLPADVVVFGPDEVENDLYGDPVTWTPSAEDVAAVDESLEAHIDADPSLGVEQLDRYHRQYVGTGEEGESVAVNALCTVDGMDWEDDLILVNDGGSCFWGAQVDVATSDVATFTVNGVA